MEIEWLFLQPCYKEWNCIIPTSHGHATRLTKPVWPGLNPVSIHFCLHDSNNHHWGNTHCVSLKMALEVWLLSVFVFIMMLLGRRHVVRWPVLTYDRGNGSESMSCSFHCNTSRATGILVLSVMPHVHHAHAVKDCLGPAKEPHMLAQSCRRLEQHGMKANTATLHFLCQELHTFLEWCEILGTSLSVEQRVTMKLDVWWS